MIQMIYADSKHGCTVHILTTILISRSFTVKKVENIKNA